MTRTIARLGLAWLVVAIAVPVAAQAGADKFAGKWVLNAAKSQFSGGGALGSSTVTITNGKHGAIRMTADATRTDGRVTHYEFAGPADGSSLAVTGTVPWDSVTLLHPDKNTVVRTERKGGHLVGITTATLAADGKSFTSVRRTFGDATQLSYTALYERAKH